MVWFSSWNQLYFLTTQHPYLHIHFSIFILFYSTSGMWFVLCGEYCSCYGKNWGKWKGREEKECAGWLCWLLVACVDWVCWMSNKNGNIIVNLNEHEYGQLEESEPVANPTPQNADRNPLQREASVDPYLLKPGKHHRVPVPPAA